VTGCEDYIKIYIGKEIGYKLYLFTAVHNQNVDFLSMVTILPFLQEQKFRKRKVFFFAIKIRKIKGLL
jgi:hypothetical protein